MLSMDATGALTSCKGAPPKDEPLATHVFAQTDGVLRMWATPVAAQDDLDSPRLLTVPLPAPFGVSLVLAPVLWQHTKPLAPKQLHSLLGQLRESKVERTPSVLLQPTTPEIQPGIAAFEPSDDEQSVYDEYDEHEDLDEQEEEEEDDDDDDDDAELL